MTTSTTHNAAKNIARLVLPFLFAVIVGLFGGIIFLNGVAWIAHEHFSFISAGGAAFFVEGALGSFILWAGWRLLRGCIVPQTVG